VLIASAVAAAPLELLALGIAGVAAVVAVGSALAAYSARRAVEDLDEQADPEARR
jgi:membrane protein implicated in regulation of membrane protease activity